MMVMYRPRGLRTMTATDAVPMDDPFTNAGLDELPEHLRDWDKAPAEPDDPYIFNDPRVRKALVYAVMGLAVMALVLGAALTVEWFQVGRHQGTVETVAAVVEPTETESSDSSLSGGLLRLAVGFLGVVAAAGFIGMQVVRPGQA